jgi:aryl-alcohol dehydrogenase-like predicted oxidoreductase
LSAAWDVGVNFFDTARSYGIGESESILGAFLRGRRDRAVISSKAGIYSKPPTRLKRLVKNVARPVLRRLPSLRRRVGAAVMNAETSRTVFSVADMRTSLEESLRELRTDYLDVFLLHNAPAEVHEQDDVFEFLEAVVREGKARRWGLSGGAEALDVILASRAARPHVLQVGASVADGRDWDGHGRPGAWASAVVMAHQPFGGGAAVPFVASSLRRATHDAPESLRATLQGLDADLVTDFMINGLLTGGPADVVLAAAYDVDHIARNVRVLGRSRFTGEQLAYLRSHVRRDVAARP